MDLLLGHWLWDAVVDPWYKHGLKVRRINVSPEVYNEVVKMLGPVALFPAEATVMIHGPGGTCLVCMETIFRGRQYSLHGE